MTLEERKLRAVILESLRCRKRMGYWTGNDELQLTAFLLQASSAVELSCKFTPCGRGMFSEASVVIAQMVSESVLTTETLYDCPAPIYEGKNAALFEPGDSLSYLEVQEIQSACEWIGNRDSTQLQALLTAAMILTFEQDTDPLDAPVRVCALRPIISLPDAQTACERLTPILRPGVSQRPA